MTISKQRLDELIKCQVAAASCGKFYGAVAREREYAVLEALRELRDLREASEWRPIATAPRDGTRIVAWRLGEIAEAYRVQRDDCEMWSFGGATAAEEHYPGHTPSYWRPLPPPPKQEG
jgi:hypothetical protein